MAETCSSPPKKKVKKLLHVLVFTMLLGRCWKLETDSDGLRVPTWSCLWLLAFLEFTRNWTWRMPKTCFLVSPVSKGKHKKKKNIQNAVPFFQKNRICGPSPHRSTGSFPGGFPKFGSNLPVNLSSSTRVNWGWLLGLLWYDFGPANKPPLKPWEILQCLVEVGENMWAKHVMTIPPVPSRKNCNNICDHLQQGWIGGDFWVFWYDFGPANKPPLKPWEILQCLVEVGENMWAKHVMTIPPVPSRKNCNNICDECKGNWLPKWPEHADWWNDCSHPAFRFWCKSEVELSEGRFDGESSCCAILVLCELHAWA